jgi:RNA polymerase sigma-70 factor (ECF subfamily)
VPSAGSAGRERRQREGEAGEDLARLRAALAAGDRAAFERVVREHYDRVYRIAWRMLGGPADAEDVAQEAFVRLWQGAHRLREAGSLRAWLAKVASNLAVDRLRRRRPEISGELPEVADPAEDPERQAERQATAAVVDAAIAALPERQRIAIVLTYYEELTNAEVAGALEVSIEAVESLLARARRTLKERLAAMD